MQNHGIKFQKALHLSKGLGALCSKSGNCINNTQGALGLFIERTVNYHKIWIFQGAIDNSGYRDIMFWPQHHFMIHYKKWNICGIYIYDTALYNFFNNRTGLSDV